MKVYTQEEIKNFPKEIPLAVGINKKDGKIIDVKKYRHNVKWNDSDKSSITYCNNCGSSFLLSGTINVQNDNKIEKKACLMCPDCKCFQGWKIENKNNNYYCNRILNNEEIESLIYITGVFLRLCIEDS